MSELGNLLKSIRESQSLTQETFAKAAGVSMRSICNIEEGEAVRKTTLDTIIRSLNLPRPQSTRLLQAWIRQQLGHDAELFYIDPKARHKAPEENNNLEQQVIAAIHNLPKRYQQHFLKASGRPEILRALAHLNDLQDRLGSK